MAKRIPKSNMMEILAGPLPPLTPEQRQAQKDAWQAVQAERRSKSTCTAAGIILLIRGAIRQFGEYEYFDKGCHEVMDIDGILKDLDQLDTPVVKAILLEVAKMPKYGHKFVSNLACDMQEGKHESLWEDPDMGEWFQ